MQILKNSRPVQLPYTQGNRLDIEDGVVGNPVESACCTPEQGAEVAVGRLRCIIQKVVDPASIFHGIDQEPIVLTILPECKFCFVCAITIAALHRSLTVGIYFSVGKEVLDILAGMI